MRVLATLKFGVAPEGDYSTLLDTINRYMNSLRIVVWYVIHSKETSLSKVSKVLYEKLKSYGLPSYLSITAIKEGIEIAKSWLNNPKKGRYPILRKKHLTLHQRYSYKIDLENFIANILTTNGRIKVRLLHDKKYVEKFKDWFPKGAKLLLRNGKLFLHVTLEKEVIEQKPKDYYGLDVNYREVVLSNGKEELRFKTMLNKAFHYYFLANRLQEKYGDGMKWRFNKKILNRIKHFFKKSRNVIEYYTSLLSTKIVNEIVKRNSAIVMEDLRDLKFNVLNNVKKNWRIKLNLLAYRKLQRKIEYKLNWYGYKVHYVNPNYTSSTCPRCNSKLINNGFRRLKCVKCGFEADRDTIACLNILKKFNHMWEGFGSPSTAPDPDENPMGMMGKLSRGSTFRINIHKTTYPYSTEPEIL